MKKHPRYNVHVTRDGRVFKNGKQAKLSKRPDGYLVVSVGGRGAPIVRVHALVMETYVGPRPPGAVIRHLNPRGDRADCRLSQLCYGTPTQNAHDTIKAGRHSRPPRLNGAKNHFYRGVMHSAKMRHAVKAYLSGRLSSRQAAARFGVSRSHMLRIARRTAEEVGGS